MGLLVINFLLQASKSKDNLNTFTFPCYCIQYCDLCKIHESLINMNLFQVDFTKNVLNNKDCTLCRQGDKLDTHLEIRLLESTKLYGCFCGQGHQNPHRNILPSSKWWNLWLSLRMIFVPNINQGCFHILTVSELISILMYNVSIFLNLTILINEQEDRTLRKVDSLGFKYRVQGTRITLHSVCFFSLVPLS